MKETYDKVLAAVLDNLGINHTVTGDLLDLSFAENLAPDSLTAFFSKYDIETLDYQSVWLVSKLAAGLHYAGVPKEQGPRIRGIVKKFTVENGRGLCELPGILEAFSKKSIDAILLNGTAMKAFYQPEETRFRSNLDILVHSEDVTKAGFILEEQDFSLRGKSWKQNVFVKNDVRVALHRVYLRANILTGDCTGIWQNSLEISWHGKKVFVPCPEMSLLILLAQGLEDSCSRISNGRTNRFVNDFLDIKFFLKSDSLNREKFIRLVKKSGFALQARLMLDVMNHLYPGAVIKEVLKAFEFTNKDIENVRNLISYNIAKKRMADAGSRRNRTDYYYNSVRSLWNLNCYYGNRDSLFSNMIDFPKFISVWNSHKEIKKLLSGFGGYKR